MINRTEQETAEAFYDLLSSHILPLLHSTSLAGPFSNQRRSSQLVSFSNKNRLKVYLSEESKLYFSLQSATPYSQQEKDFVERVLFKFREYGVLSQVFFHLLGRASVELAIAEFISPQYGNIIYKIIQIYNQWSTQTYEGSRISHSIGIHFDKQAGNNNNIVNFGNSDFLKTLGARPSTILTVDCQGDILGLEIIDSPKGGLKKIEDMFAPICVSGPALWSEAPNRAVVHLTGQGELLLFRGGMVLFAKRRAHWRSFPHSLIMEEINQDHNIDETERNIRRAVYLTAIDVAFEHKGGCLGILEPHAKKIKEGLGRIRPEYLFDSRKANPTTRLLGLMINERKFFEIPRHIRAELCSIDGAVILSPEGQVLTVGAILKTKGNAAQGGGRTAATIAMAKSGMGIKISNDGYIEIHSGKKAPVGFL